MSDSKHPYSPPIAQSAHKDVHTFLWIAVVTYVCCFASPFVCEYYFNPKRFTTGQVNPYKVLAIFVLPPLVLPAAAAAIRRKFFYILLPWSLFLLAAPFLLFGAVTLLNNLGYEL